MEEKKKYYKGLTEQQVIESRKNHGENIVTPPPRPSLWRLFLEKFEDPIIKILLIAALLSLIISFVHMNFAETVGIIIAILLATVISFIFEVDANRKFDILNKVNDDTLYKVVRNETVCEIPKKEIVVGDIIILELGEEIPADGKLLEAISLQVNESTLTGEPVITKTTNPAYFKSDATYPSNRVYRGTTVVEGHGVMEVDEVGDKTEFGKVAQKSSEMVFEPTPLNRQLDKLAKFISIISFSVAILTFCILFIKDFFFKANNFTVEQKGSIGILLLSAAIMLTKIWFPVFFNIFELLGKKKKMPPIVESGSWIRWISYGLLVFIVFSGLGYIFGIDPLNPKSWISLEAADHLLEYFLVAVTLIVVSIPEGLPMSVTLSLALNMRRMLKNQCLVRKLHASETMGALTVICTDKTGTLTQNRMKVNEAKFWNLSKNNLSDNNGKLIVEAIATNTTAHIDFSDPKHPKPIGNSTEGALLIWLHEQSFNYQEYRENTQIIEQLTFSTERKYMATLIRSHKQNENTLHVKGAPELILSKCTKIQTTEGIKPLTEFLPEIEELLKKYQSQAMRTLALAYKYVSENEKPIEDNKLTNNDLIFLGIVSISDPLRDDVPESIEMCQKAGIEVKIITGDTLGTAKEIGRQIGLIKDNNDREIITGTEFEALSHQEALERVSDLKIIYRARPNDKLRMVKLLQEKNHVVAVTGDGTNDAPALNFAHVGISMGSGTSVAKEASDITIIDDSFTSITKAIMWGRSLYQNIQRFILFQLTINLIALMVVLVGSILGKTIPLTITQMLWVNLIMDTFAAAALASLPPEPELMKNKPRKNSDFIISPKMSKTILISGLSITLVLLFLFLEIFPDQEGNISRYDLTRFFTFFVMFQFWNLFNAKAFNSHKPAFYHMLKSKGFVFTLLVIIVGQILIVQFGNDVFRTTPLSIIDWLMIIALTSLVFWIGELYRMVERLINKYRS